jgi:CO/xanthine dehydrogenase FAD-binding subunit
VVAAPAPRPRRSARTALRSRRAPFVLLVVALLAGTTLGLLVLNTAIAVDSLEATRLRADNAQRAQDVQRLERQVIDGTTPAAIAEAAVAAGLVPSGTAAYLVLDADGTPVLRGEPVPAEAPPAPPEPAPAERPAGGN